jgi:hypothetical protein
MSTAPVSNNVLYPREREITRSRARAEGRRAKAFPVKQDLTWPTPDGIFDSYSREIYRHLTRVALRMLNEAPQQRLTIAELRDSTSNEMAALRRERRTVQLADRLYTHALENGSQWIASDYEIGTSGARRALTISITDLTNKCDSAATWAIEHWRSDFTARLSAAGRKGGSKSKRPPKHTVADLQGLEHLSKAQQAQKLGCSTATIARLRKMANETCIN